MNAERLNERYIELMDKLSSIMLKQGEPFRAKAYQKAQETIMSFDADIYSPNDLKNKKGPFSKNWLSILKRERYQFWK